MMAGGGGVGEGVHAWHTCLFSLAFNALLIRKEDLVMIRGANLDDMSGRGQKEIGIQLNIR